MIIYDTLSGKKKPLKPGKRSLKLFVCGPTVYDLSHIGHARTYIFFDAFARYLRSRGHKIFYLQNITDIDDRIIQRAKKIRKNPLALARFFEKEYLKDMKMLGVNSVNSYARATDFIPEIVSQIKTLIRHGAAYLIPDEGYYFDLKTFPAYGKLSRRTLVQAEDAVSRIDESIKKRNRGDFCLWKFSHKGEPSWQTKLGKGRPGWHIEDTAITEKKFGPQHDIHGGAVDLKFPHHEAEIAQQESASQKKPFVKTWMHTGFLLINGKKMSKSLGNFITVKDFLKKYDSNVLRFLILSYHYRSPINFSWELVEQANSSLKRIAEFLDKLDFVLRVKNKNARKPLTEKMIKENEKAFHAAMADDLNTPLALSRLFKLISESQNKIWQIGNTEAKILRNYMGERLESLGIEVKNRKIPQKIRALTQKRELLRKNKQFIQADALRKKIEKLGYKLEDTPKGSFIVKNDGSKKYKTSAARSRS